MTDRLDLFGWDTVFAVSYAQLNKAIRNGRSTPPKFAFADGALGIAGAWDTWQLTAGGDGQNLQLHCPISAGKATSGTDGVDLTGEWVQIQLRLDKLPDPAYPYVDPKGKGGTPVTLPVLVKGTADAPAVSLVASSFTGDKWSTGLWKYVIPGLFVSWFNQNLAEFNHVFAVSVLNGTADVGDYQWLKPTDISYACADSSDRSLDRSVFGALCLTQGRTVEQNPTLSHTVDPRLLENLHAGANSAFAIAPERVLTKLLLPGAIHVIQGSTAADFELTGDNLWVTNRRDVVWGNFTLDNGDVVRPVIAKNNFQLGLQDEFVVVQVTDATFEWPSWHGPGSIAVHMDYAQKFAFQLKQTAKGSVFVPAPGFGTSNVTTTVVSDRDVLIFDIAVGIATAVVLSIVGAAIGGAVGGSASVIAKSGTEAVIEVTGTAVEEIAQQATTETIETVERQAATAAADVIENANPTRFQRFTSALLANKWKIFGGMIGGILASPAGLIGDIVKLTAADALGDVPPFDTFAANCAGATTFPNLGASWKPVAAGLQGPLVIQGSLYE